MKSMIENDALPNETTAARNSSVPCFLCGVCCSKFHVRIEFNEAHRIAEKIGVTWEYFLENHTEPSWPGVNSFLMKRRDGKCLFLTNGPQPGSLVCSIHTFKPASCTEWNSNMLRRECQEGLAKYWDLTVDASGNLVGPPEKQQAFRTFLKTLEQ
jgi:Fe-S-cluster containining protein